MKIKRYTDVNVRVEFVGATLLSAEEAQQIDVSILECGTWWWLRSRGNARTKSVAYVDFDGAVHLANISNNGAVRPALIFKSRDLQIGDRIQINGCLFTVVLDGIALADRSIGSLRFDSKNIDYDSSGVKQAVDHWFETYIKPYVKLTTDHGERVMTPLSGGMMLVAESGQNSDYPREIYVGIVDKDGAWIQDLVVVRNAYIYDDDKINYLDGEFEVMVYGDEYSEDYTDKFSVGLHEEDAE